MTENLDKISDDFKDLKINELVLDSAKTAAATLENSQLNVDTVSIDGTSLIIVGMAGSGKTTFVKKLISVLHSKKQAPYAVNLDPAVLQVNYPVNIDIRDSINYKQVMNDYKLGPNGAIITCLNLFASKFDQMYNILSKRVKEHNYTIFDTPGQIEVFTWSASGSIITDALASLSKTAVIYLVDCQKCCENPITFMSNMLHACSIMFRNKAPLIVVLNKADIADNTIIKKWITDFESFQSIIDLNTSYVANLVRSLSLVLDEFYSNIDCLSVSSVTGEGFDALLEKLPKIVSDYYQEVDNQ